MELANYIISHANNLIVFGVFFGYASWAIYIGVNDKKKWKEQARAIQALIQAPGIPPANDPLKVGVRIKELEKPETKMYKCIMEPTHNSEGFKLGEFYINTSWCGIGLSDLPFHFELVQPETEKITWDEAINLIEDVTHKADLVRIIDRIKKDHLS